jgi:hypothetical protein
MNIKNEIKLGTVRYSIMVWEGSYSAKGTWSFQITKSKRVIFKRSKREGWRGLGFVRCNVSNQKFASRAEALAAAKAEKAALIARPYGAAGSRE